VQDTLSGFYPRLIEAIARQIEAVDAKKTP
jgi:hypothetical protein